MTLSDMERFELAASVALEEGPASLAYLLDPTYQRVEHTELISGAIVDAVRDGYWLQINTPPQVGKTLTAIQWTAFWLLVINPRHKIVILSYNATYSEHNGKAVRELVERYGDIFGLKIKRGSASVTRWETTAGGSVISSGLQGGVTGNTGTALLIDDYLKNREEADSTRYRAKILANILTAGFTRRSPGAPIIYTGTLWSLLEPSQILLDRYGRIEDGGKWRVIRLPAFADRPDDPLGRAIGDPLRRVEPMSGHILTAKESTEWWKEQQKGQNTRDWQALYLCNLLTVEGALMELADIDRAKAVPPDDADIVASCLAVDPADADSLDATGNDSNGISYVGRDSDGKVWVLDDYTVRGPVETWAARVIELAATLGVDEIIYERNKGGHALKRIMLNAWSAALAAGNVSGPPPRIVDVVATKNKVTRASPVAQLLKIGEACLSSTGNLATVCAQLATYQLGSVDSPDNLDAMVYGVTRLYRPRRDTRPTNVRPQSAYLTR